MSFDFIFSDFILV